MEVKNRVLGKVILAPTASETMRSGDSGERDFGDRLRMSDRLREWGVDVRRKPNPNPDPGEVRRNCLSPSSSNLSLSPACDSGECGFDGTELDAARALACFSRTAVMASSGRKRLRNISSARDWEDCIHGRDLTFVPEDNQAIKVTKEEKVNLEQISERPPTSSNFCSNYLSSSSERKMRQNLSQTEREARRMHRVLANRESARQTIRRRQAYRDDLTKKVSELSLENKNIKMEKEQVLKEYMSLKTKNKRLKEEMAMAIECNIMGVETASASLETLSLSHQNPLLLNIAPPFMAGPWPPLPVIAAHAKLFYDEIDSDEATEPKILLYVPPCAWFCSLNHLISPFCHFMSGSWKDKEVDLTATVAEQELVPKEKAMEVKSCKLDIDLNAKNEMPEPSFDAMNHCSKVHDEPPWNTPVVNTVNKPARRTEEVQMFTEQSAPFRDASAAAAARRRRTEIIKLKHLCGRPIGIHT